MSFKIAFIGAGSLVFARTLFTDILSVPERFHVFFMILRDASLYHIV